MSVMVGHPENHLIFEQISPLLFRVIILLMVALFRILSQEQLKMAFTLVSCPYYFFKEKN